jgi:hypothetical protein
MPLCAGGLTLQRGDQVKGSCRFDETVRALIGAARLFPGPGFLVPTRNGGLMRWCLNNGLRIVQPMTLMTMGLYNEPAGAYLPSMLCIDVDSSPRPTWVQNRARWAGK